jgi:DNA-directed RNA polymerase
MATFKLAEVFPEELKINRPDKYAEEIELELEMKGLGSRTFHRNVEKARSKGLESNTPYGQHMMKECITPMAQAITKFIIDAYSGKRGNPSLVSIGAVLLTSNLDEDGTPNPIDPEVIAFITAKQIVETLSQQTSYQQVAIKIGRSVEDQVRFSRFEQQEGRYFKALQRALQKATKYQHKKKVFVKKMNDHEVPWEDWSRTDCKHVGTILLELYCRTTGHICFPEVKHKGIGKIRYVECTPKQQKWIREQNDKCEILSPMLLPMIVEPKNWVSPFNGGFLSEHIPALRFVIARSQGYLSDLRDNWRDIEDVYKCVNTLQRVPWKINKTVLKVAKQLWDNDLAIADLPKKTEHDLPPYPFLVEWDATGQKMKPESRKRYKEWKELNPKQAKIINRRRAKVHKINAKMRSKRNQMDAIFKVADKFIDQPEMYFVYQCDFRSRVYAVQPFLNPQSADYSRGLIQFANGKPIEDEESACWFMINGAGLYGYDKVSLQDRVKWSEEQEVKILECAHDPISNLWWSEADKPFQFLAWCYEYEKFHKEGYGFISHLPVHLDGSCNAYQHMCALLRDEVGGKLVNLTPSETPQDIYQSIANVLLDRLDGDKENLKLTKEWKSFGVDRKTTKTVTMCYNYGLTPFTARKYVEEYIEEKIEKGIKSPWGDLDGHETDFWTPSKFLSDHLWQSICTSIYKAPELMRTMQQWVRIVSTPFKDKAGNKIYRRIQWSTPTGFPVDQAYPEMEGYRVKTKVGDSIIKLQLTRDKEKTNRNGIVEKPLSKRKQVNSCVANYIHSIDASALMISTNNAKMHGIDNFAMIHDSYGILPSDVSLMNRIIRQVFVDIYTNEDLLQKFKDQVSAPLSPEEKLQLLPMPKKGNLDINEVLESDFFFA